MQIKLVLTLVFSVCYSNYLCCDPIFTSIGAVVANPKKFHEKEILVGGYLVVAHEVYAFCPSADTSWPYDCLEIRGTIVGLKIPSKPFAIKGTFKMTQEDDFTLHSGHIENPKFFPSGWPGKVNEAGLDKCKNQVASINQEALFYKFRNTGRFEDFDTNLVSVKNGFYFYIIPKRPLSDPTEKDFLLHLKCDLSLISGRDLY